MEKRAHQYKLTLSYLETAKGDAIDKQPIELEFANHDDIFSIIERIKAKHLFNDENEATEFAIGLKMFSEVMTQHTHQQV